MRGMIILLGLAGLLALSWLLFDRYVPDRHDPFAPLRIADQPGLFTSMKIAALKMDAARCRDVAL